MALPKYNATYVGSTVPLGTKFSNYEGIICVNPHVGVYPLDIFSRDWERIGDNRALSFLGTDTEKKLRLSLTYQKADGTNVLDYEDGVVSATLPMWGDNGINEGTVTSETVARGTAEGSRKLSI